MQAINPLISKYVECVKEIYGSHVKRIILYGSYARGDFNRDSDVDIMILLDLSEEEAKAYQNALFDSTYDFNMDHDIEINPISHSEQLYRKWLMAYPFFQNVEKDGVNLYGAA